MQKTQNKKEQSYPIPVTSSVPVLYDPQVVKLITACPWSSVSPWPTPDPPRLLAPPNRQSFESSIPLLCNSWWFRPCNYRINQLFTFSGELSEPPSTVCHALCYLTKDD
ncbi:hypothetical protein PoB_007373200 [Plakobranchus ocellatus]|uniref:Uncharacterized protein n=1 Tax=Plakobranchus ocellatus TaxID=259542 RepID=A0AAV4DT85_9GAST|nr:hypothetical protein PoB_007373200 [Plakobranchus ocellatus]